MLLPLKKLFFSLTFNSCLFLILIIGIQNSYEKGKINFLINETIEMPVSFIIGTSFIGGSIFGCLISFNFYRKDL